MSDVEYWGYRDGEPVKVPPIDELCLSLKDKFLRQEEENKRLKEENQKLKDGVWKDEKVAEFKASYDRMKEEYFQGFSISKKEWKAIQQWKENHECPYNSGPKRKITGNTFTYVFYPTPLGTSGVIKCSCGKEFQFQEIG